MKTERANNVDMNIQFNDLLTEIRQQLKVKNVAYISTNSGKGKTGLLAELLNYYSVANYCMYFTKEPDVILSLLVDVIPKLSHKNNDSVISKYHRAKEISRRNINLVEECSSPKMLNQFVLFYRIKTVAETNEAIPFYVFIDSNNQIKELEQLNSEFNVETLEDMLVMLGEKHNCKFIVANSKLSKEKVRLDVY